MTFVFAAIDVFLLASVVAMECLVELKDFRFKKSRGISFKNGSTESAAAVKTGLASLFGIVVIAIHLYLAFLFPKDSKTRSYYLNKVSLKIQNIMTIMCP